MANARTGSQSSHGGGGSTWSGMPPAQTHLPHPTYRVRLAQREQWLRWRRTGRMPSTGVWTQPTHSSQLLLNRPEPVDHWKWAGVPKRPRQPPEADHRGGEFIQVPPPETVSGSPKRQCCIGPGHNHSSLQRLRVSTCMCAPFIIYYEPTYSISIYFNYFYINILFILGSRLMLYFLYPLFALPLYNYYTIFTLSSLLTIRYVPCVHVYNLYIYWSNYR